MIINSPSNHFLAAIKTTDNLMKRLGKFSQKERIEKCFGFRVELAIALFASKYFNDSMIFKYEVNQLKRVSQGVINSDDLEYDFIVPGEPSKINAKGTLNEYLVASKRFDNICYILGAPADRNMKIIVEVDLPITLVGWCMGSELIQAPTYLNVPFYCPNLHPMEELWR